MKTKKKKKWKDVRSALVMVLVMAAMMSTATYAWFTMTSNPTVTGLQMVASSGSGLSVSNAVNEAFVNAIQIKTDEANMNVQAVDKRLLQLIPVSLGTANGTVPLGFCDPVYDANGIVTGLKRENSALVMLTDEELKGKVAKYTYYIRSESENVGVGILMGDATQQAKSEVNGANQATASGTFVRNRDGSTDQSVKEAYGAVRIGLVVTPANNLGGYDTPNIQNMIILEPNVDYTVGNIDITSANAELTTLPNYSASSYTETVVPSKLTANIDGTIQTYGSNKQSNPLFTVGGTPKQVTMYIWLEGTDSQCVDQIKTDEMEAQIQFVSLGETATESNVPFSMN